MKDRIETIEKRLDRMERTIERIVVPLHFTNLAVNGIALQIQRVEGTINALLTEIHNHQGDNTNLQERLSNGLRFATKSFTRASRRIQTHSAERENNLS